jgi:hypothetical protein
MRWVSAYLRGHVLGLGSLLALVALALLPCSAVHAGFFVCPFRHFLGIPCPGCGLTRSLWLAVHGEPGPSYRLHPLGFVLLLVLVVWSADVVPTQRRAWRRFLVRSQGWVFLALVAVWLLRLAGLGGSVP